MGSRNLHDSSKAAVAERRAFWARRSTPAARTAAAASEPLRRGRPGNAAASHVVRYARNPVKYTRQNSIGGALITFVALVLLASLRRGRWPNQGEWLTLAGGTLVVVVLASVAPDLVTGVLLVVLLIFVLSNTSLFLKLLGFAAGRASSSVTA